MEGGKIGSGWHLGTALQSFLFLFYMASASLYSNQKFTDGMKLRIRYLLILLWIAVDVGVICGGVAYLYGLFYVRSIFQKIAE
jgi:hypothetical protein